MSTVVIHQPDFIPWLGFFHRLVGADTFIVLDDVQFLRQGWHHRDKIKLHGKPHWLTVPVETATRYTQKISETRIAPHKGWKRRHLTTLTHAYGKAPYFTRIFHRVEEIYKIDHTMLMDLNLDLLRWLMGILGIEVCQYRSSSFGIDATGTERLVGLVEAVKGRVYLTGEGSHGYLDETVFTNRGLTVQWQKYRPNAYAQGTPPFIGGLSVLDALFYLGPRGTRALIIP